MTCCRSPGRDETHLPSDQYVLEVNGICVGCVVLLTVNVDVGMRLVNGQRGIVVSVNARNVCVDFYDHNLGIADIGHSHRGGFPLGVLDP